MSNIDFTGQWIGHFTYGPDYGQNLHGEKVQFRIFINDFSNGEFTENLLTLKALLQTLN